MQKKERDSKERIKNSENQGSDAIYRNYQASFEKENPNVYLRKGNTAETERHMEYNVSR